MFRGAGEWAMALVDWQMKEQRGRDDLPYLPLACLRLNNSLSGSSTPSLPPPLPPRLRLRKWYLQRAVQIRVNSRPYIHRDWESGWHKIKGHRS